ncbi:MAG: hypothetical protein JO138_07230 [Acidobacteriaceae bacterium]|nr:hypothetical protein [Acidobacteriaceae bacterium]
MKKATKAGTARSPAKKRAAPNKSAKAVSREAGGQAQMMKILERLAQNAERLARAAERLETAVRPLAAQQSKQQPEPQGEELDRPGEIVGMVVVDEGDEE